MLYFTKAESSVVRPTVINSDSHECTAMNRTQGPGDECRKQERGVLETQNVLE